MEFFTEQKSLSEYLQATEAIDHENPKIRFVAKWLMDNLMKLVNEQPEAIRWTDPEIELAALTYEFVRDRIKHSADISSSNNYWRASDVLDRREGLCYGKSHLLAALLRANGIPSALCYQYLRLEDNDESMESPLIIHGLNAVYFQSLDRWIRLDARGNKTGVNAEFSIDEEKLAFPVKPGLGETDLPLLMASTDRAVMLKLKKYDRLPDLMQDLPTRIAGASAE
jgi:transglutaminase-like putative cysteine protease